MDKKLREKIELRGVNPGSKDDAVFILSSWLQSYAKSEYARTIPRQIYFPGHQKLLVNLMQQPNAAAMFMVLKDDPDHIIGYVVYDTKSPVIHYVYVKQAYRRLGFGGLLLQGVKDTHPGATLFCSHKPKPKQWIKLKRQMDIVYNPYAGLYELELPANVGEKSSQGPSDT